MDTNITKQLDQELAGALSLGVEVIQATRILLEEGNTIPFIARYRKERTGNLDEVSVGLIQDGLQKLLTREERRAAVLKSLEELGIQDPLLIKSIQEARTLSAIEDLYLPYRPKRRTRAQIAREKGLAPLAEAIKSGKPTSFESIARELDVPLEDALAGARDILAEELAELPAVREAMRTQWNLHGILQATLNAKKASEPEAPRYRDYFNYQERGTKAPGHRILAIFRAEELGILSVCYAPDPEQTTQVFEKIGLQSFYAQKPTKACVEQMKLALGDSYKRLLAPAMETEGRRTLKERADQEAIDIFVANLRAMLLASPYGQKSIMALDPGIRTGCKLVVLSPQGDPLHQTVIYPHDAEQRRTQAGKTILSLKEAYPITAIAIGDGTAGRETLEFLQGLDLGLPLVLVNESGASIYSASPIAREEFPELDLTIRSAISIGRRFMDPLSELVKIDPKSIGVGQYQHDVDQKNLAKSLDSTVISCVNAVGVELNTASPWLLSYVSGLSPKLAQSIVLHRKTSGPFGSRMELRKVKGLGPKAFEQAAGFLRIRGGKHPLDASAVHPESYEIVEAMAKQCKVPVATLIGNKELLKTINAKDYVNGSVGLATINDILQELAKPGRDPRPTFENTAFNESIRTMEDLEIDMVLTGKVANVTAFGAFIDIGVHTNALAHISQLSDDFVKDPLMVVQPGQIVSLRILELDHQRKRIGVTLKKSRVFPSN